MLNSYIHAIVLFLLLRASSLLAFTNLSPTEVHERLVRGDTLLLLDVREWTEYLNGHIAEPTGQLPLTPANMPWNSNVLSAEYSRLPQHTDILVYCGSGRRSALASAFLESKGFTRIFNMTGGFSSWPFESRPGGYGDHSGKWVKQSDTGPVTISCPATADSSQMVFPSGALPQYDSFYVELHAASSLSQGPPNVPQTELDGLFRITLLDPFGLSGLTGDVLALADSISLQLFPRNSPSQNPASLIDYGMSIYVPDQGWKSVSCLVDGFSFHRKETILRKWYVIQGSFSAAVRGHSQFINPDIRLFPNPFNGSIRISAPPGGVIRVFDSGGRFVEEVHYNQWVPSPSASSGVYFFQVAYSNQFVTKKAVFLK